MLRVRSLALAVFLIALYAARGVLGAEEDLFDDELVVEEEPDAAAAQEPHPRRIAPQPPQPKVAEYDEEFDGGKEAAAAPPAQRQQPKPTGSRGAAQAPIAKPHAKNAKPVVPPPPLVGSLELAGLAFFILFGLNYLRGRRANEAIASKWAGVFHELLETQFASVGDNGAIMMRESCDTFTIDATGRERCDWLQARLKLSGRQDLYQVLLFFVAPRPDKLCLDIGIAEDEGEACTLAVLDKRLDGAHVAELPDLKMLCSPCPGGDAGLPASLRALCEAREVAAEALGGEVGAALAELDPLLEQLHYTDLVPPAWGLPAETKRALHLVFRLPAGGADAAVEATRPMLRLALLLLDRLGRLRLSPQVKEKLRKGRAAVEALKFKEGQKQREAEAQQRKAERLRAARDKAPVADRELQRKREEKEARQAAKKKGGMKMKRI